ncbi:MAG: putative signal peptide peptidase SppA [Firmicutes bacterium ADurb.Bin456]|nr:MAG: putative signal peptide peptidase SppA [Firmicutes bacterium ADurb.Bin456]
MRKKIIAAVILGAVALSLIFAVIRLGGSNFAGSTGGTEVGIICIEGVIAGGTGSGGLLGGKGGAESIASLLREASRDPGLKAVVIRLNSPGGTPAASQEIEAEIKRLKESGKVVVASLGDVAASGAYWVAAGADRIVANPGTITGSIGVIMETANLEGLYDKIGITPQTYKSGPFKDMGSPSRPATAEERAIFQSMIEDVYEQFIETVARGRHKDPGEIKALADGRVYTGRQARELGLVDSLGDFHDAVLLAGELAGIEGEPSIVNIGPKNFWSDFLGGVKAGPPWGSGWFALPGELGKVYPLNLR